MCPTIVNLTLPVVTEEVEVILGEYSQDTYQELFAIFDLRQSIINYVMSQIPNSYSLIEENHAPSSQEVIPHYTQEDRLQIENLIHRGIRHVLRIYHWTNNS